MFLLLEMLKLLLKGKIEVDFVFHSGSKPQTFQYEVGIKALLFYTYC
jgi:hypothetical protein